MNAISPLPFQTEAARRQALATRDKRADGHFVYAVVTTGVFCRPSCAARPARPENLRLFADPATAAQAGYRPCKRCQPDAAPRAEREAALVADACRAIEAAEDAPSLEMLARAAGLSSFHFHRLFRRLTGVTPRAYWAAQRTRRTQASLQAGGSVTGTIYEAGFSSPGRFYAAADGMLGMRPSSYRAGGAGELIRFAIGASTLGLVLVAATAKGVCAILLGENAAALEADLRTRFDRASLTPADDAFASTVAQVVGLIEAPEQGLALPLDIRGTAFQRRVWEALQAIPPAETISYGALAARLGSPMAVRAVARACAANKVAVAVPCHRVVGADGALTGYRWGVERKRALLEREQRRTGKG